MINAIPIWDDTKDKDSWRQFFVTFSWDGTPNMQLHISAESTFEVCINGHVLPIQQLSDSAEYRTYTSYLLDGLLQEGNNVIHVIVHWVGEGFSTCMTKAPYLLADIASGKRIFAQTGSSWKCAVATMYKNGACRKLNRQLGFGYEYDARQCDKQVNWNNAVELSAAELWDVMVERPVPSLRELPLAVTEVAQCGFLRRYQELDNLAETCQKDWLKSYFPALFMPKWNQNLPEGEYWRGRMKMDANSHLPELPPLSDCPDANGYYIIADLGEENVGYLTFKLTAPAGAVVDILHGEHLDSGRVRAWNGFDLVDRYVCREDKNEFCFRHRRLGCRFIELHVTHCEGGAVFFDYVGMIPVELPLPAEANFSCRDRLLMWERALSVNTMKKCMHEHYEDTPWREQSLYAYDARQQMLYGYYAWGNYDFVAASLDLFGRSYDGERNIKMTAPSVPEHRSIPIFSIVWISAVCEHFIFSGDRAAFLRWQPVMDKMLGNMLALPVEGKPGLYSPGFGDKIWNFCEWNGTISYMNEDPQLPYNFYLAEALQLVAKVKRILGDASGKAETYEQSRQNILQAVKREFYDQKSGLFRALPNDKQFYEHMQVLALKLMPLTDEEKNTIFKALLGKSIVHLEMSAMRYMIDAMMEGTPETRNAMLNCMQTIYEPMIKAGATTVWETHHAAEDFQGSASLSHAWGAIVPYWTGAYLLGVKPLEPGYAKFTVRPWNAHYEQMAGEIPTAKGMISVSWKMQDDGMHLIVRHPKGTVPVLESYPECPIASFKAMECN